MISVKAIIEKPLALFVTTTCPFCKNARALAAQHGIEPTVVELDRIASGSEVRTLLTDMTKQRTVPYVFTNNKFIGGFSDLAAKKPEFWTKLR